MKLIILFLFFNFNLFSQKDTLHNHEVVSLFKEITKSEGSELNDSVARHQIFIANHKKIIDLIKYQGFPNIKNDDFKKREKKLILGGFAVNFCHILQVYPKLILNDSIIKLIKIEIDSNRLDKNHLIPCLKLFIFDNMKKEKSETLDLFFKKAIDSWGIKESDLIINNIK